MFALTKQKGVTLIELIIVVIVVGLLAIVGAKSFGTNGVNDAAKAQAMFEASVKLSTNATLIGQAAGTGSATTSNPMVAGTYKMVDVLIGGSAYFNSATYPTAYAASGITPLTDVAQGTPGGSVYTIAGLPFGMVGGGTVPHKITFTSVPDTIVQVLVTKYGSGATIGATADSTNASIQYGTPSAGSRSVSIIRQL